MNNKINVAVGIAKCPNTKKIYGVRVEERRSKWYATWAFPIKPETARREGYVENDFPSDLKYDSKFPGCPYCGKREDLAGSTKKAANIVFIIDTTGSMTGAIDSVKERVASFADKLEQKKIDCNLGLIGFGDVPYGESPTVYSFTKDINKFKNQVSNIPRTHGGDLPESALDALETGLASFCSSKERRGEKSIFVLITDAPPHDPTVSGKSGTRIAGDLKNGNVVTYILAGNDTNCTRAYKPICTATGGKYYNINDDFSDILDDMATSIVKFLTGF
ncbi:MAG: VWA domain-containing protein [Oscillospiraceae bacterium]|nr:VWA domain-containing protein [Oscillospiraceae bacterium]